MVKWLTISADYFLLKGDRKKQAERTPVSE